MKIVLFYHSVLSDWNHGNAHFLRGVASDLLARGHDVRIFEPRDAWSVENLVADHGAEALDETRRAYPTLHVTRYDGLPDLDAALEGAELVIVHEWNTPALVEAVGRHRASTRHSTLLFHDTHHRSVSDPDAMASYELSGYDGVLAFGEVIRRRYLAAGWSRRVWTWHEAADVRVFRPHPEIARTGDVVWVGNWGDDERTRELAEFLIEPVRDLRCSATVHGVRYPADALATLRAAGLTYRGWVPNYRVPGVFARHRLTMHVPRRPYVTALPGIPTIRPFEALACGIPLICAPWRDDEQLFRPGVDYLEAEDGAAMRRHIRTILHEPDAAAALAQSGLETIRRRHTCAHRVDELLAIHHDIAGAGERRVPEDAPSVPGLPSRLDPAVSATEVL